MHHPGSIGCLTACSSAIEVAIYWRVVHVCSTYVANLKGSVNSTSHECVLNTSH